MNDTREVFKFKYINRGDELEVRHKVKDEFVQHGAVVVAFFDWLEECYGYELRSRYLKDAPR